jgi:hypothetical protein
MKVKGTYCDSVTETNTMAFLNISTSAGRILERPKIERPYTWWLC